MVAPTGLCVGSEFCEALNLFAALHERLPRRGEPNATAVRWFENLQKRKSVRKIHCRGAHCASAVGI